MPTPAKNMSSSIGLIVWSMPTLKSVAAQATEAMTANSSPPVIGSGMLYFESKRDPAIDERADEQHDHRCQQ